VSVILSNSFSLYCILQEKFSPTEKKKYSLKQFLKEVITEMVPPCKLVEKRKISELTGKPISAGKKCYICRSKFNCLFQLPETTCNHYCERCSKWMHLECQYLNRLHTPPPLQTTINELATQEPRRKKQKK
jgi:hypothetical protein